MAEPGAALEMLLRRDRLIVITATATLACVAWVATVAGVGMPMSAVSMTPGLGPAMPMTAMEMPGGLVRRDFALVTLMWWLMMIAMMLPSATPAILLATALRRRSLSAAPPFAAASVFVAAYLGVWLVFSALAAATQLALRDMDQLSPMLASERSGVTAAIILAAGVWQLTPLKEACLARCRSPVSFLVGRAGQGARGAVAAGVLHGAFCLGCCWALMALLFAGGVMNLWWIAALTLLVAAEKLLPAGQVVGRVTGFALIIAAAFVALA